MKGYRLTVIRHGLTEANDKSVYIGSRSDYSLSDKGRSQLVNKLDVFQYPKVQRVYSSPLKRCTETAELLFPDRELYLAEDFRELDFGEFDGKSVKELIDREDYKDWLKGGADKRPPDGESLNELTARIYRGLHTVLMDMMQEELTHCTLITHSGIITNIMAGFGIPKYDPKELTCQPGEGFEILTSAKLWQQSQVFEILGKAPYETV